MMVRQLRDKVPKGEYVIRASVLDRLIKNRMEYKFIEYGNRMKDLIEKQKLDAKLAKEARKAKEKETEL